MAPRFPSDVGHGAMRARLESPRVRYATPGFLAGTTRAPRRRQLPTKRCHAALLFGVIRAYQPDSSSKPLHRQPCVGVLGKSFRPTREMPGSRHRRRDRRRRHKPLDGRSFHISEGALTSRRLRVTPAWRQGPHDVERPASGILRHLRRAADYRPPSLRLATPEGEKIRSSGDPALRGDSPSPSFKLRPRVVTRNRRGPRTEGRGVQARSPGDASFFRRHGDSKSSDGARPAAAARVAPLKLRRYT